MMDTQEMVPSRETHSPRNVYHAYKVLLKQVAERLLEDDLRKIHHFCDLSGTVTSANSLDVLTKLEKKGKFSHTNVGPLKDLLENIDRCDLVNQFVDPFKKQHGEADVTPGARPSSPCAINKYSTGPLNAHASALEDARTFNSRSRHPSPIGDLLPSRPSSRAHLESLHEETFPPSLSNAPPPGLPQPPATPRGFDHREEGPHQYHTSSSESGFLSSSRSQTPSCLTSYSVCVSPRVLQSGDSSSELALHTHNQPGMMWIQSLSSSFSNDSAEFPESASRYLPFGMGRQRQKPRQTRKKAVIGRQVSLLSRKEMVNYVRDHRNDKNISVRNRLQLNLGCKHNPTLGFKVWPCGLGSDKDKHATLQVAVYFPTKCSATVVNSRVRLTVTVVDEQTGELINTCSVGFFLSSQSTTLHQVIPHGTLLLSRSVTIKMTMEVELLDFNPQSQSNAEFGFQEVPISMDEHEQDDTEAFLDIQQLPEITPLPETHLSGLK